jgi:hypothetical protein
MRRLLSILLAAIGIIALVIGAMTGGFGRILYFSSQICLSCMGLV